MGLKTVNMKQTLLFILLLCQVSLFAQRKYADEKGFLGFTMGPSIPIADFGKTNDFKNSPEGFAKTGMTFNILSMGYRIYEFVGISAMLNYGNNELNKKALTTLFNEQATGGTKYLSSVSSPYSYGSLMAGSYFSFPLRLVDLEIRAMGGVAYAQMPKITANRETGGFVVPEVMQKEATSVSYSYDAGLGIKFSIMDELYFIAFIDYFRTDHNFVTTVEDRVTRETSEEKVKKSINYVLPSVGVAYKFREKKKYRRWAF